MKLTSGSSDKQSGMLWRCVSALRRTFKNYHGITRVRIQVFFGDNEEPGYTYEDKLE